MSSQWEWQLGDRVRYVIADDRRAVHESDDPESVWIKRSDEEHLCIVIRNLADGGVQVWDTDERDWFMANSDRFVEVQS